MIDTVADLRSAALCDQLGSRARLIGLRVEERVDQAAIDVDLDLVRRGAGGCGGGRSIGLDREGVGTRDSDGARAVQARSRDAANGRIHARQIDCRPFEQTVVGHRDGDNIAAADRRNAGRVGVLAHAKGFGQHRVAKAIDRVSEFGADVGVHQRVREEAANIRADLADELIEQKMLIMHLDDDLGLLEQLFTGDHRGRIGQRIGPGPAAGRLIASEAIILLQLGDHAVVFGQERLVHGGEADVLVQTAFAGNDMGFQRRLEVDRRAKLARRLFHIDQIAAVPGGSTQCRQTDTHVDQEGMLRRHQHEGRGTQTGCRDGGILGQIGVGDVDDFTSHLVQRDHARHAIVTKNDAAGIIKGDHRHRRDVCVVQDDTNLGGVFLDQFPGGNAGRCFAIDGGTRVDKAAGGQIAKAGLDRRIVRRRAPLGFRQILTHEEGAGRVRTIVLAHVDERRGQVEAFRNRGEEIDLERTGLRNTWHGRERIDRCDNTGDGRVKVDLCGQFRFVGCSNGDQRVVENQRAFITEVRTAGSAGLG